MSNVDALGREFLRNGRRKRTQCKLGRSETAHLRICFDGGGCAGEYEGRWIFRGLVFSMLQEERETALGEDEGSFPVLRTRQPTQTHDP